MEDQYSGKKSFTFLQDFEIKIFVVRMQHFLILRSNCKK